jgi:alcohol dehydrogenase class IV
MNLDNFSYHMPTRIVYGLNSLGGIDKFIKGRRTLLVTSQSFVARGLVDEIKSNTNNIVKVISNVKSHPEFKNLKHIYKKAREVDFDLILAIGGGSVIDVAKYISVCESVSLFLSVLSSLCLLCVSVLLGTWYV